MPKFFGQEEVFWVGLQSIFAALGLVGLFFYTRYTKKMTESQEESRRASLTPKLVGNYKGSENHFSDTLQDEMFEVTNVGGGVAIHVLSWMVSVPDNYVLTKKVIHRKTGELANIAGQIRSGETKTISFQFAQVRRSTLFVVSGHDALHGIHQLHFHRRPGYNGHMMLWSAEEPFKKPRWERLKRLCVRIKAHTDWLESQIDPENSEE